MPLNLRVVTPATAEPIALQDAFLWVRKDVTGANPEDAELSALIRTAREAVEQETGRTLTDAVYEYRVNAFPRCCHHFPCICGFYCRAIPLPVGNIGAVSTVEYVDEDGNTVALDTDVYTFDDNPDAPTLRLKWEQTWPTARREANAVVIRFQGQYGNDSPNDAPPQPIIQAMRMLMAHFYAHREAVNVGNIVNEMPLGIAYMLRPYRLGMGV